MPFSGSQVTRLGNIGITRGLTGSFAGKTEATVFSVAGIPGTYDLVTPGAGVYAIYTATPAIYDLETPDAGVYEL